MYRGELRHTNLPLKGDNVPEGRPRDATTTYLTIPGVDGLSLSGTFGIAANTLYHECIYVSTNITVDQILIEVTTLAAGASARLGIYTADRDWQPVSLVLDAGTVSVASIGVKSIAINQVLPAGKYLLVMVSDGAPSLRRWAGSQRYSGWLTTLGAAGWISLLTRAFTYATLPDPPSDWDTATGGSIPLSHFIFLRVSVP